MPAKTPSVPSGVPSSAPSAEIKTEPGLDAALEVPSPDAEAPSKARKRSKNRRPEISDTVPAIPVAAFRRLVREISHDRNSEIRWEADALEALQVDAEAFLIQKFDEANKRRRLAKVKTLDPNHFGSTVEA